MARLRNTRWTLGELREAYYWWSWYFWPSYSQGALWGNFRICLKQLNYRRRGG